MLGRVKKWFGIEGLKIAVQTEEKYNREDQLINGVIVLKAKDAEQVEQIKVRLVEKYSRGRGKNRLIDEYTMAEELFEEVYDVPADTVYEIPFEIVYSEMVSTMDQIERKNFLYSGLIKAAKFFQKAKSIYRLEIEAKVKGTKFSPFVSQEIIID